MASDVTNTDPVLPPVTPENLNLADILVLIKDVVQLLGQNGFIELETDGHYNFTKPTTGEIVTEALAIEALLKQHGLKVSPKMDKAIQSLPLLIQFLGN